MGRRCGLCRKSQLLGMPQMRISGIFGDCRLAVRATRTSRTPLPRYVRQTPLIDRQTRGQALRMQTTWVENAREKNTREKCIHSLYCLGRCGYIAL